MRGPLDRLRHAAAAWPAFIVWGAAWAAMAVLDGRVTLGNLALVLVLAANLAAIWLPWPVAALGAALAVTAFNIAFVPPRGRLAVDLHQDALLLATMLAVSGLVSALMARQRQLAREAMVHERHAERLRRLSDALREVDDPCERAPLLQATLTDLVQGPTTLLLMAPQHAGDLAAASLIGEANADRRAGLELCLTLGEAMGPGTGRHEEQPGWYLPMRAAKAVLGAAWLPAGDAGDAEAQARRHRAQALCDQMGEALDRAAARHAAAAAREAAQAQSLRNTLLAAISHDQRTPLAAIVGAASSLHEQGERLSPGQRQRLAAAIVDEASQLARMADNTLQLARLDSPTLSLHLDWESAEELVGSVLRRMRQRDPAQRLRARVEPGLPFLRCDAVLLVQLLDNLVDNALKYAAGGGPVEIVARRAGAALLIAVRDRGPGIPLAMREAVFDAFQRGEPASSRRGAGIGLALCRAVARAHRGELRYRPRHHGGASFELWLPVVEPPPADGDAPMVGEFSCAANSPQPLGERSG